MLKKLIFTALLALGAFANSLSVGSDVSQIKIKNQVDAINPIAAETKTILFASDKATSDILKEYLLSKEGDILTKNNALYVADISGMPSLISKFIALPKMKKYPFSVMLLDDTNKDFFGKEAYLTVTGQLHVEAFALTYRDVYTFGPAFRAENSNTSRHASEFWMIEPEIAFADLEDDMDLIEDMVKYCIDYVLDNAPEEMKFFESMIDKECIKRIKAVRDSDFKRMTYTEAIDYLLKADVKFENKVEWGMDLNSEHERYMRLNDDGKTVAACDLLVPGIGELVGGSQREERYDVLEKIMDEKGMAKEGLQWYMDLRRFGGCKHAGFGLGFDRFLMYLTGMQNIRDVEPFPRTPRNLKF
mgnify:CR=1 FL=1